MLNFPHLCAGISACFLLTLSGAALGVEPEVLVAIEKNGDVFVVEATIAVAVPLRTAWEVLVDFDNMAGIMSNLTLSRIIRRKGSTIFVQQEGKAKFGPFSYSFASVREIELDPMRRILARQLSGSSKRFESEMELSESGRGTRIRYLAHIVPDSGIAQTFGGPFIQHEVEEQFQLMTVEMMRRAFDSQ